jgi:hypothetical protein
MKTIWKYSFPLGPLTRQIPRGGVVLSFAMQFNIPCIWVLVDDGALMETRQFRIVGTGQPLPDPDNSKFIGTVLADGGNFVWHLFEIVKQEG